MPPLACTLFLLMIFQFADFSEYGYGVAFLSESKYGYACEGNVLRLSLLRAATAPDAEQDQGTWCFFLCMLEQLTNLLVYTRKTRVFVGSHATCWFLLGV